MDPADRRALFVANEAAIRRAARRFSSTTDDANDIVQDTAVVVLAHDHGPPDAERFVGWCCVVARHLALHRRRSEARAEALKEYLQRGTLSFVDDDPERVVSAQRRLEIGLDRLDEESLSLLWNRFVLEETSVEAASRLHRSPVSIRMRLSRLISGVRESQKSTDDQAVDGYAFVPAGNDGAPAVSRRSLRRKPS
ncbi:MAG TPA: sigma-70 family RNA polymerase sigma factor [Polyangiaceae bacterium]|nr:sigma-70 family RNA polymerase sigma factor [Polyangiaceae bacterium]